MKELNDNDIIKFFKSLQTHKTEKEITYDYLFHKIDLDEFYRQMKEAKSEQ